jgi:hypothetical protein
MRLHLPRRPSVAAGAAVAVLCVLASCGTSSTPTRTSPPAATTAAPTTAAPSSTAAPSASGSLSAAAPSAACEDVAELKSSLEALTKVDPAEDGVPALRTAIAKVRTDLVSAEASVSEALEPQVKQVKTAFGNLQTAAANLTPDNRREKAPEIAAAMKQVRTATAALSSTLTDSCPGS